MEEILPEFWYLVILQKTSERGTIEEVQFHIKRSVSNYTAHLGKVWNRLIRGYSNRELGYLMSEYMKWLCSRGLYTCVCVYFFLPINVDNMFCND